MHASIRSRPGATAVTFAAMVLGGCAALDDMAVGETRRLEEGEFYGPGVASTIAAPVVVFPVRLDPELVTSLSYARRETEFAPIVKALDGALLTMPCCMLVREAALPSGAPHVYVGSAAGEFAPPEAKQQLLPQDRFPPMVMHVARASHAWQQSVAGLLAARGTGHAILVTLSVSQYPKGREGAFGKKVVLGTGHEERIEFLTAEDKLLEVLQLNGVLVDAQGRVVRAGAEGILARDTPFGAQVVEIEKALDDRTLERVLTKERRDDLPGSPLKWEVALANLLAQLRGDRGALLIP